MTAAITMTWILNIKPEFADQFWSDVAGGTSDTRSFPGCRRAVMYRNQEDPNQIMLTSDWDSHEDYEKHSAWRAGSGRIIAGKPSAELPTLLSSSTAKQFWNVRA